MGPRTKELRNMWDDLASRNLGPSHLEGGRIVIRQSIVYFEQIEKACVKYLASQIAIPKFIPDPHAHVRAQRSEAEQELAGLRTLLDEAESSK